MDRPPRLCSVPTAPPEGSTGPPTMRLAVISTTGSPVELTIPRGETVEGLRTHLSRRLRLRADRIVLVHKHRQLTAGSLLELGVTDGSSLTLLPVIQAGLVRPAAGAGKSFKDTLESLTEFQVRDFLSGLSPIYITLEVGTHVMYVELQLSGQDVTELQRKQDPGAENIHPSATDTWVPGQSSSQFSPRRPRTRLNSKDCASLSERAAQTRTCWDGSCSSCSSCSSPGQASASACPRHSWSQQRGSSTAEGPTPAPAVKKAASGVVIERFVSPSPGFCSGAFSGTLASSPQSSISQHQHGVAIILQILDDLLKAPRRRRGPPPAPSGLHRPVQNPEEEQSKAESKPGQQRTDPVRGASGERPSQGNQTLHFKLKQLQVLMHRRRQQKLRRRNAQTSTAHPYRQPQCRP